MAKIKQKRANFCTNCYTCTCTLFLAALAPSQEWLDFKVSKCLTWAVLWKVYFLQYLALKWKSGWGISRPYSWGFPSWYQHRPHESYSQVHSFVILFWFDRVSLSDSTSDGNKMPPQGIVGSHKKKQKRLTSTREHKKLIVHRFYIVMAVINLTDLNQDLNKRGQGK